MLPNRRQNAAHDHASNRVRPAQRCDAAGSAGSERIFWWLLWRGLVTLVAVKHVMGQVKLMDCARILPTEASGTASNFEEPYVFTDLLIEFDRSLGAVARG